MPKGRFAEDLSGKRFGNLTVLERGPNQVAQSGRKKAMFLCKCDCGTEKLIPASRLNTGAVMSCGCMSKKPLRSCHLDDLTGQRFGRWTVMYRAESVLEPSGRKAVRWHCRCDCGTERDVRAGSLKSLSTRSCGCLKHEIITVDRDLKDNVFGRWHVLERGEDYISPYGRVFKTWHCRCECGIERDVAEQALISGRSVSCGCYRLEQLRKSTYNDLTGQVFGKLTVLYRLPDKHTPNGNRIQLWVCKCECGRETVRSRSDLVGGSTFSCGCQRMSSSKLEDLVCKYLEENLYQFEYQKKYSDLIGPGGRQLSYDFLVYKNNKPYCLIECQGLQHFEPVDWFGGNKTFESQKIRDKLKMEYAQKQHIPLVEIMYYYDTYEAVSSILDEML